MRLIILIFLIFNVTIANSMNCKFISAPHEIISSDVKADTIFVEVKYSDVDDTTGIYITCLDSKPDLPPFCSINDNIYYLMPKSQGNLFVPIFIGIDSSGKENKAISIKIKMKNKDKVEVTLDELLLNIRPDVGLGIESSDCNISLGANFDLIDGPISDEVYADVYYFKPKLFSLGKFDFGLFLGTGNNTYNKTFEMDSNTFYKNISPYETDTTSWKYLVLKMKGNSITSTKTYRMFLEPIVEIFDFSETSNIGKIFAGLKLEYLYNRTSFETEYKDTISVDTVSGRSSLNKPFTTKEYYESHTTNFMLSFILLLRQNLLKRGFELKVNFAPIGYSHELSYVDIDYEDYHKESFASYSFYFELKDLETKLKIGGELKGFYGSVNPKPFYSLFIAKEFSLSKLADFGLK
ncbi:MAG: hypothetical protein V1779_10970 [bacterium]